MNHKATRIVDECIKISDNAICEIRTHLKLTASEQPRIAYIPGPGDVLGTFKFWLNDEFDPRVPVIAYSTQFYTLIKKINAIALVIHEKDSKLEHGNQYIFEPLKRKRSKNKFGYFFNNLVYSIRLINRLYRFKPHIVIFSTDIPPSLTVLIPRKWRPILSAHNTYWNMGKPPSNLKKNVQLKMIGFGLKKISAAVCTSHECARQIAFLTKRQNNLHVQTPQLLTQYQDAKKHNINNSVKNLLYVGRIEKNKGIFDLLVIFEKLSLKYPHLKLSYAGSGSYDHQLEEQIHTSKANVVFLGRLSGNEVHNTLKTTDILVCPTRSDFNEGLAMVCIEAAIHGVPSIVSTVVPARELLDSGIVVFPVDDALALEKALMELIEQPEQLTQLSQNLFKLKEQFFDRNKAWGAKLYKAMLN